MKWRITIILTVIVVFINGSVFASQDKYEVHFLDTGQSDCILIKACKKNYLIDTGAAYYSDKILRYLSFNGINKIDALILTHYHDDHYGGFLKIIENIKVETVLLPKHDNEIKDKLYNNIVKNNIKIKYIGKNFKIKKGRVNLKVVAPIREDSKIENNNSLVLQGNIDGINYLFAADCEKQEEEDMIKSGELQQCDILKLPHHSLDTSSTNEFLDVVKPKIVVVTCNGVETPDEHILNRIYKKGVLILRTDKKGNITVRGEFVRCTKDGTRVRINRNEL